MNETASLFHGNKQDVRPVTDSVALDDDDDDPLLTLLTDRMQCNVGKVPCTYHHHDQVLCICVLIICGLRPDHAT